MVSPIAINFIDAIVDFLKASESKFFQILEIFEIQSFKLISLIILIVGDGSVKIIDATFDI